jgi:hydrogenase 3 maturation protease
MKVVILGVGNRFRGDDAIGSIIAEELQSKIQEIKSIRQEVIVYDTEITPENFIDKVIDLKSDWVIFIDACNFKGKPGEFKLFEEKQIKEISYGLLSTHTLPLTLTIELIKKQHACRISLLGIQPKQLIMGEELSAEVKEAKEKVIEFIKDLIKY